MHKQTQIFRISLIIPLILAINILPASTKNHQQNKKGHNPNKSIIIENFDDNSISLESYAAEDNDPSAWELNSEITCESSPYSLKLFGGDTWKLQNIQSITVDTAEVWQVSAYIKNRGNIQGFGVTDGENVLFYSFAGSQKITADGWIPVYQGCFAENQWNNYKLPIADDWMSLYNYLPNINGIIYVNDNETAQGIVYFDNIINISSDLPCSPVVSIDYSTGKAYKTKGGKSIDIQFTATITDTDSDNHSLFWDFGDGEQSTEHNPQHTYLVNDDHDYTVLLKVKDQTDRWGWASCNIEIEQSGSSSFPVTMNFVGDIMMARNFEYPDGIIPTQGVNAIFEPTKAYLSDSADITVANLECPLTTHMENHPTKTIYFKSSPTNVNGLLYAGIDIVTLANNHILDYLEPGIQQTMSVLDEKNILHMGAGANSYEAYLPVFYSKKGVNFAFLAASDRTGQYNNYQPYLNAGYNKPGFAYLNRYYIKKQINKVSKTSDFTVLEWHCGNEYSIAPQKASGKNSPLDNNAAEDESYDYLLAPSAKDISIRHYAIDEGADLLICHHPHIIQGVELYKGKLIAHSLGNFVFDISYPETFPSMILNTKVNKTGFYEFTITPIFIDNYIPQRAEGQLGLYILDDLAKRSHDLNTYLKVDREKITAQVIMDTLNMIIDNKEFSAQAATEQVGSSWITPPVRLKKEGNISLVTQIEPAANYEFRLGTEKIWYGNMEDEGSTMWQIDEQNESYCDTAAYSGTRSLQQKRTSNSFYEIETYLEGKLKCRSNDMEYSLAGYIKTQNGKNVTIKIKYYENRNGYYPISEDNIGIQVNGNTPWTFYHKTLIIPNGTKYFDVVLVSGVPNSGTAYSWFDNVSLICWDNWGKYSIGQNIAFPNNYYFLQAKTSNNSDETTISYTETVFDENIVSIKEKPVVKADYTTLFEQNFPNPFNPVYQHTNFVFNNKKAERVSINIFNINGQKIKVLTNKIYQPGNNKVTWDGTNSSGNIVDSGVYFYQINAGDKKTVKKCIVMH